MLSFILFIHYSELVLFSLLRNINRSKNENSIHKALVSNCYVGSQVHTYQLDDSNVFKRLIHFGATINKLQRCIPIHMINRHVSLTNRD